MSGPGDEQVMLASPHRSARAGNVDSAIDRQVADSLPKESLAWRKTVRTSPTYPLTYCRSKLYFYSRECVLCYPLYHSLELW